jgi:hypothetical protein
MNVRNDTIEIDRIRVDDEIFRYHNGTPWRSGEGLKLGEGLKHSRNQKRWAGPRKGQNLIFEEFFNQMKLRFGPCDALPCALCCWQLAARGLLS